MKTETTADGVVGAVRRWLAETERLERITRRYASTTSSPRIGEAQVRVHDARISAAIELGRSPGRTAVVDGRQYYLRDEDWAIYQEDESSAT